MSHKLWLIKFKLSIRTYNVIRRGKFGPATNFFVWTLGVSCQSKDAFFVGEYDASKQNSKFDQRILGLTVLKFRKFEFGRC